MPPCYLPKPSFPALVSHSFGASTEDPWGFSDNSAFLSAFLNIQNAFQLNSRLFNKLTMVISLQKACGRRFQESNMRLKIEKIRVGEADHLAHGSNSTGGS